MCRDAPEPLSITAGDTVAWTRALGDYPASAGWTLNYTLAAATVLDAEEPITFVAATGVDGISYAVNVPASATVNWAPGRYLLAGYVVNSAIPPQRFTVARGSIQILPNPVLASATTHAQRALSLIEAALEGRLPRGLEDTTIDGQQLVRMAIRDLAALREKYRAEVYNERRAAAAAAGVSTRRTISVAFVGSR
jgi:hypothetical protein